MGLGGHLTDLYVSALHRTSLFSSFPFVSNSDRPAIHIFIEFWW